MITVSAIGESSFSPDYVHNGVYVLWKPLDIFIIIAFEVNADGTFVNYENAGSLIVCLHTLK